MIYILLFILWYAIGFTTIVATHFKLHQHVWGRKLIKKNDLYACFVLAVAGLINIPVYLLFRKNHKHKTVDESYLIDDSKIFWKEEKYYDR